MAFSSVEVVVTFAGMTGIILPFGDLYDATPILRVVMFGLITSLIVIQTFHYVCACVAERYLRRRAAGLA